MMKTIENKSLVMTDEGIAELQNFETKDFRDYPIQTPEQLKAFKPKYSDEGLYKQTSKKDRSNAP